ncbi:MAG: hypothetical protein QOH08_2295 [Chloroflexota bacterium]|jgi:hypothetical protein|nr:hypothetical protein [Chloroflexota bacterium]
MQVSQVAFDRFVLELPPADSEWRPLADPEVVAETAAWLWDFGPTPLIGIVGSNGAAPSWLSRWQTRQVNWAPDGTTSGRAVILANRTDLERFLVQGAPHEHTELLWPSVNEAKTFEALAAGGTAWHRAVDAHARIQRNGEVFEVSQTAPV